MTPKEKAEELVYKYKSFKITAYGCLDRGNSCIISSNMLSISAKQCALIAVNEVLRAAFYANDEVYDYYMKVKLEIEKL